MEGLQTSRRCGRREHETHGRAPTCQRGRFWFGADGRVGFAFFIYYKRGQPGRLPSFLCPLFQAGAAGLPCRLKKQGCRGLSSPGAATGSIQCPLPLRAPYTTHACMLPASAQPEPSFACAIRHAQKTVPGGGRMDRRGCKFTGGTAGGLWNTGHLPAPAPRSECVLSVCLAETLLPPEAEYFFECPMSYFFRILPPATHKAALSWPKAHTQRCRTTSSAAQEGRLK